MSVNEEYKELYESKDRKKKCLDKIRAINEEYINECKKVDRKRKLSKEEKEKLKCELYKKYSIPFNKVSDELDKIIEEREKKLYELAEKVEFYEFDEWYKIDERSGAEFSTQGFGANKYAEASLFPLRDKLKKLGINARIEAELYFKGDGSIFSSGDTYKFTLYAKCPPWMADAANRLITLKEWSISIGRTTNPKVLNPFLPDSFLDVHFSQAWD